MKLTAILAALPALTLAADEILFNRTQINEYRLRKRQGGGNVITHGIQNQGVYPRLEIRQMESQQSEQMTLLFLAMAYFQGDPESDDTGYYGLSKIHGVPHEDWNGVGQCSNCAGADGYCEHSIVTFPCFHRAYVALFEEHFIQTAQALAYYWPGENGGDAFRQAASTMRLPYWDWAADPPNGGPTVPQSMSSPQVTITDQSGQRKTMDNPLYSSKFTGPSSPGNLYYGNFNTWGTTLRYPSSSDPSATSEENVFVSNMDALRPNQKDSLYTLMTGCGSYFDFSNDVAGGQGACVTSLEQLHDNIHIWVGGQSADRSLSGHMAILAEAAFDPAFWLHHSMVDRLFAMWQTIHSDYSGSQQSLMPTWTYPAGYTYDMNTGLAPFRQDANTYFTCNTVRDWTQFGYTYPEFVDSDGSAQSIQHYVDALYGPNSNAVAGSSKRDLGDTLGDVVGGVMNTTMDGLNQTLNAVNQTVTKLLSPTQAANGSLFQYFANIHTPRFTLDGSYSVVAFHGEPASQDTSKWLSDSNLIGAMGVFSKPGMSSNSLLVSGQIPLTRWATDAQKAGQVDNLSQESMIPFLQRNLRLYIIDPKGQPLDPKNVQGFMLNVTSSTLALDKPTGQKFSHFTHLTDVAGSILNNLAG